MLGEILRGLPAPIARARLWQNQGKVGGFVQAPGRPRVGALLTNETKAGLRAHDAVVVFNLVGQLHGSTGLSFRIIRERNGRRVVGNSRRIARRSRLNAPPTVAPPASLIRNRRSSLPFALVLCAPSGASASLLVVTTSSPIRSHE